MLRSRTPRDRTARRRRGDRTALQRLDDRVVPVLQRGAHATARRVGATWPVRAARRTARLVTAVVTWPFRLALVRRTGRLVVAVLGAPFWLLAWAGRGTVRWLTSSRTVGALERHRMELALAAAVIAFIGSYVHLQRYPDLRAGSAAGGATASSSGSDVGVGGDAASGVAIGPSVGVHVAEYVDARHRALAEVADGEQRLAVVSFGRYLTAAEVAERLPADVVPLVALVRVPAEAQEPFPVELGQDPVAALEAAAAAEAGRLADEADSLQALVDSESVNDPAFQAIYEQDLQRLNAALEVLDTGTGMVFAVVVHGPVTALRAMVDTPDVRLVDVAPTESDASTARFYGVLPEDRAETTFGAPA